MSQPIRLQGARVTLRSITHDDLDVLYDYIYGDRDPAWKRFDAPYFPLEPMTREEFQERMRKRLDSSEPPSRLAIEVEDRLVGQVSYYWEHRESNWLEAGIVIYDSSCWSGGYGTEALGLWIDHLFATMSLVRVGITTWSGNPRMIRCAEKLGLQLEGRMRRCRLWEGQYYDSIRMGVLREEWEVLRPQLNDSL